MSQLLKGGEFIVQSSDAQTIFIPEEWNEEQRMMAQMVYEFMEQEIHPNLHKLDVEKYPEFNVYLLEKAGELGLLGLTVPEEYGGMNLDFLTGLLFGEAVSSGLSFATTIGAQTSIGSLPILYYGTKAQKEQYIPRIVSGELKASYCLTEPDAGSDANSGKTKAVLNEDGTQYIVNGQKMWITNGGFADIFIVFAKIEDDENLSAFIIEKKFGGIEIGPEEKKLGIKGSSTVQVFFNDCKVPIENLLGKRGGGFKMALNILNTGRIKLAAGSTGGSKMGIKKSVTYANQRKQFKQPISNFGAIKYKLAEMALRTFATESGTYRTGDYINKKRLELEKQGKPFNHVKLASVKEYAVECAIMKVHASEVVAYCADESLQIHGGMGFAVETGVERGYRDARILRIYEGTNEINRMLSVGELFKRSFKDKAFDMVKPVKNLPVNLLKQAMPFNRSNKLFDHEWLLINNIKNVFLFIAGRAAQKYKLKLTDEQEIIMNLADILAEAYVSESVFLRVQKIMQNRMGDVEKRSIQRKMAETYLYNALQKVRQSGEEAIMSFTSGIEQSLLLKTLARLTPRYDINPKEHRRAIANYLIKKNDYPF